MVLIIIKSENCSYTGDLARIELDWSINDVVFGFVMCVTDDGFRLAERHACQSHPGLELPTSVDVLTSTQPALLHLIR